MLTPGHPRAWDVDAVNEHLDPAFRAKFMPAGADVVITPQLRQLITGMPACLGRGKATALSGPVGAGKTTIVEALAAVSDVNTAIANITAGATNKAVWETIASAVTDENRTGTARNLQATTLDYITSNPTLLIVDEAQHIGRPALMQLRWLWAHPFPRFAIVLAGSNLFAALDADDAVGSRIDRRIPVHHHSTTRMVELVRAQHPQAAATDPHLLASINDSYAHGSWRAWSKLLLAVVNDLHHTGPLTDDIAAAAILEITGVRPALTTGATR